MSSRPQAGLRRVVVTGAGGFLGRHLTAALAAAGIEVVAPSRRSGFDLLSDRLDLSGIDHLFHLAARTGVVEAWEDPVDFHLVNAHGTLRVLDQCRRQGCPMTFVSGYVYGQPTALPIAETAPVQADNPYAFSKFMAEEACRFYARCFDLPVAMLRLFNIFGPGQSERFVLGRIARQVLDPHCAVIEVQDLAPRRDYLFVGDAVQAILRAPAAPSGSVVNIGSGRSHSVGEVIALACRAAGVDKPVRAVGQRRHGEIDDVVADIGAAQRLLGWAPATSMEEGLRQLLDSLRQTP